jgi:hypothetical protein
VGAKEVPRERIVFFNDLARQSQLMKGKAMPLASQFGRNATMIRSHLPPSDECMMVVAPSIFAEDRHDSLSQRCMYIPTIEVLRGLSKEGCSPFMVCPAREQAVPRNAHGSPAP